MTNHYKTPESEVDSDMLVNKSKIGWKVFFWILLFLEISSVIAMIFDPEQPWLETIMDIFIYGLILTGLFGFSYNKKIINKNVWGYVIPVGIAFDIYSIATMGWGDFESEFELYFGIGFMLVIGLPLMVFEYLGLFKYRYHSNELWSK